MRRRKLLIGIGAAAAGGSAAFGTEAFSSVEAERSVDVAVAGDQSAYLALTPGDGEPAASHVTTTGGANNNILEIDLDGDGADSTSGSGVNDNAITKYNDLFRVLNQGSQAVQVYIEDGSDVVTFRSDGSSIEGPSQAVELGVGEEMIVSLTVDTLNNSNSTGQINDKATIWGVSEDPSGSGPVAEFNHLVGSSSSADFSSIQAAVDAASENDNIGLEGDTFTEAVTIATDGLTLQAKAGASPTLETSAQSHNNKAIIVDGASDITIDGLTVTFNGDISDNSEKYGIRARAGSDNLNVRNSEIRDFSTADQSTNSGAVRATGIVVTDAQGSSSQTGGQGTAGPIIENCKIANIRCTGSVDSSNSDPDSKAKGIAMNGDVSGARVTDNTITNIGTTSNDPNGAQNAFNSNNAEGTSKPRGIALTEASDGDGPTAFEIVRNDFSGIAGTYGQPSIFVGGMTNLGSSHSVQSNNFRHPVDSLANSALQLEQNYWSRATPPTAAEPDTDATGGIVIDRDSTTTDGTDSTSYSATDSRTSKVTNAGSSL